MAGLQRLGDVRERILRSLPTCVAVEPELKDAADFVFVRHILGDEPRASEAARFHAALAAAQDEAGWPGTWHAFGMAVRAGNMLGERPARGFDFYKSWRDPARLIELIATRDWARPWRASIEVLHAVTPTALDDPDAMGDVLAALAARQADDGGWGRHADAHHRLAAAFHFLPVYEAVGQVMPGLDRLARQTTAMRPMQAASFLTMDAAYVVAAALRAGAIERTATRDFFDHLTGLIAKATAFGDRHEHVAAAQLLALVPAYRGCHDAGDAWQARLWRVSAS